MGFQPTETFTLYDKYSAQLHLWNLAFEKFMVAKSQDFSSKEIRGAGLLKIHHTTARIMAGVRPNLSDLSALADAVNTAERFMEYVDDFQIVINLSRSLIAGAEQDAKNGKPPLTFSTDLGVVGPLYYTCIKCPIVSMRTAAMELINKCPRKEGMWNSVAVAKMIEEYWEIEARHKAAQETGEEVDESGFPVPLSATYDLIFTDGMNWEWRYTDPSIRRNRSSTPGFVRDEFSAGSATLWRPES